MPHIHLFYMYTNRTTNRRLSVLGIGVDAEGVREDRLAVALVWFLSVSG